MQFPTQTSHRGAQGENSPIITMGPIWGETIQNYVLSGKTEQHVTVEIIY